MQVMTSNEILHLPNVIYVLDAKDAKKKEWFLPLQNIWYLYK